MDAQDIDLSTTLTRSDKLVHTAIDGDVTMMNIDTGRYYSLTAVGARIWSCMDSPIRVDQICERLRGEFRVERSRCEQEVLSFVRRMADEGVVCIAQQ